jgi:hypothetical protein
LPAATAIALTVVFWLIAIDPAHTGELAVGVDQSRVQWIVAPGVASLRVTDCPVANTPATGENVGVATVVCASRDRAEYTIERSEPTIKTENNRENNLGKVTLRNARVASCR